MHPEPPPIRLAIAPTVLTSIVGLVAGAIISLDIESGGKMKVIATGLIIGFFVGTYWAYRLLQIYLPDRFHQYETEEEQETVIVLHTAPTEFSRIKCGLTNDDWRKLAKVVHAKKKFTVDLLQASFGNQTGRELYSQTVETLKDAKILMDAGRGVVVTDMGKRFFEKLATPPPPTDIE